MLTWGTGSREALCVLLCLWIIQTGGWGHQGMSFLPRMPGHLPLPAAAHFRWHYRVYMREHRAPQQSLSQGNRKLTSGHLGCLCSEAVDKAERAGRGRLLDNYGGISRHRGFPTQEYTEQAEWLRASLTRVSQSL